MKALDIDIDVDEDALAPHFDFIYRSLSDRSVAYSFYRAAAVGEPTVTHDVGLGARIVEHYKVGLLRIPRRRVIGPLSSGTGLSTGGTLFWQNAPDRSVQSGWPRWLRAATSRPRTRRQQFK